MVLVNLGSLSTSELRNLAEQEKIDDFEDMDRDELIASLNEKYEDENTNSDSEETNIARTVNVKNVSGFSDRSDHSEYIKGLPGVEELPDCYQETSIHFLYKNSDWGYTFWSISSLDKTAIEEKGGTVILVVNMTDREGKRETYDILIGEDDGTWNIGFSRDAVECYVSLVVEYEGGKREILVQSTTLHLPECYWLRHSEEMKSNDTLFKIYLSLLTTKTGEIISNRLVQDIIREYREEDRE